MVTPQTRSVASELGVQAPGTTPMHAPRAHHAQPGLLLPPTPPVSSSLRIVGAAV
eukprot:CAMPEP_0174315976 /NCGR_PEP_ID=MMETSP0810-20121108/6627_1 /TAXON_ID=73025 ORGANISM="Eutreptiella gymnastica-like, Strain CCMP1594" /NCGR_SAMPLE_ID=MMETSP0810 /ASSEMBLY_ACC=CAM_ASM_000659 /LENGTH=54 /DNA_ID=CAMNT_0015425505 /DNA_START=622 /DNA_END=786 /DNA_ORIENTATION=+